MFLQCACLALLAFYATAKAAFPTAVNNQITLTTPNPEAPSPNSVTDEIINPTNETMMAPNPEVSRPDALVVDAIKKWPFVKKMKSQWLPEAEWHKKSHEALEKIMAEIHGTSHLSEEEILRDYVDNKGIHYPLVKAHVQDTGFFSTLKGRIEASKKVKEDADSLPKKKPHGFDAFSKGETPQQPVLDEQAAYEAQGQHKAYPTALNTPVNSQITSKAPSTEETRREEEVGREDQDTRAPSFQRRARR